MYFCLYGKKFIFLWKNAHGMLVGKKKELNNEYIVYFCCFLEKNICMIINIFIYYFKLFPITIYVQIICNEYIFLVP